MRLGAGRSCPGGRGARVSRLRPGRWLVMILTADYSAGRLASPSSKVWPGWLVTPQDQQVRGGLADLVAGLFTTASVGRIRRGTLRPAAGIARRGAAPVTPTDLVVFTTPWPEKSSHRLSSQPFRSAHTRSG